MRQEYELPPIVCNPTALSAELWAEHQVQSQQLFQHTLTAVEELLDGYAFHFPTSALLTIAAFVANEHRCCPFLSFTIKVPPAAATITLRITGSPEAKAVIAAALLAPDQRR